jgi:hypothetical protein
MLIVPECFPVGFDPSHAIFAASGDTVNFVPSAFAATSVASAAFAALSLQENTVNVNNTNKEKLMILFIFKF